MHVRQSICCGVASREMNSIDQLYDDNVKITFTFMCMLENDVHTTMVSADFKSITRRSESAQSGHKGLSNNGREEILRARQDEEMNGRIH